MMFVSEHFAVSMSWLVTYQLVPGLQIRQRVIIGHRCNITQWKLTNEDTKYINKNLNNGVFLGKDKQVGIGIRKNKL
jgi:hypothetical protein